LFFLISVILFFFPFKIIKSRPVKNFQSFLLKENFIFQREKFSFIGIYNKTFMEQKKKDLRGKKAI